MIVSKYTHSSFKKSTTDIISAGTCDDNSKIIKLSRKYKNPKFYPRKFEKWSDTFSITLIDETSIEVRRTDVKVGGWGETLLIDVEFESDGFVNELTNQKIPRVIYQTFETYDVPNGMYNSINSWLNKNTDYEHHFFDAKARLEFIEKHFSKDVLDAYIRLLPGAFKADLWRCCVLYEKGGVYVDADMICLKPLSELIDVDDDFLIARDDPMSKRFLANGFIASIPKHPFLKKQIDNIVDNVKNLKERYYLDISGPGLFGKSVNDVCGRSEYDDFDLGVNVIDSFKVKILLHDYRTKSFKYNDEQILVTEYPNKISEMNGINNKTFYSMYQNGMVYQSIPLNIYFTTYDRLGINTYMYESFKSKNKHWKINHYDDSSCLLFLEINSKKLNDELGIDVLSYYKTLENGGEKSDLWRYCVIYLNGGVYSDADTYCNVDLSKWVNHHDLVFGLEACLPLETAKSFGMDKIGFVYDGTVFSVCNWTFAAKPKHEFFKSLIIDIVTNPIKSNVLLNTGPGRLTKHVVEYFGDVDYNILKNNDLEKNKSILFSINRFGANQSHSNSIKNGGDELNIKNDDVYVIHKFEGSWRRHKNKEIRKYRSSLGVSHNLTIHKTNEGYHGVARIDKDTTRTIFMKRIGDCRTLLELKLDNDFNVISELEKPIMGYDQVAKFEDYKHFKFKNEDFYVVSYIDEDFNTKLAVLDSMYHFLGDINIDEYNVVSWTGQPKIWEKNWLFFEKDGELYFIYSSTPRYIVYKCINFGQLRFEKHIDIEWPLAQNVPSEEYYFTSNVGSKVKIATGGSTNPIFLKDKNKYLYFIHTKIYNDRKYNHYAVLLDTNFIPIKLLTEPIIKKYVHESLMFVSSVIDNGDYFVFSGGVEDNTNFVWELSKGQIFKLLGI